MVAHQVQSWLFKPQKKDQRSTFVADEPNAKETPEAQIGAFSCVSWSG
jgi:hypothetical protein